MIKIVEGIPLIEEIYEYDIILFAMGINNSMTNGFSYDIAINFPNVLKNEMNYRYGDNRKYGTIHETNVDGITFISCYIKKQGSKHKKSDIFIDYTHLDTCLSRIKEKYKKKKIACPLLGFDEFDGNGEKETILNIFKKHFKDSGKLTLYIYKQKDFRIEIFRKLKQARYNFKHGLITKEDYFEVCRVLEWRKLHGIYEEVPNDFIFKPRGKAKRKIIYNKNGITIKK